MRNADNWRPTKYVYRNGRLRASTNSAEVAVSSRLVAELVASHYEENIRRYVTGRLADLGCGKVPLFEVYRDLVTDNICVDWQNARHEGEYLDYECNLNHRLRFEDEEFQTIILSDVLEHISEPQHFCNEMARILARGGRVLINVPFLYRLHERPHDYFRYTEHGLRHLFESAGLNVLLLERVGGSPEVLADILAKHLVRVPVLGNFLALAIQSVVLWFVGTGVGGRISRRTSVVFPLGYFLVAERPSE